MTAKNQTNRISDGTIEARLNEDGSITIFEVPVSTTGEFVEILTVTDMPHLAGRCFRKTNYRAGANSQSAMNKLYEALMDRPEMQDYI